MKQLIGALLLIISLNPLFAGGQSEDRAISERSEQLELMTTTNIIHDVVKRIAGDRADVKLLIDYGQNPHAFEPAPRDMAAIERADIVFVNGFDLEESLMRTIKTLDVDHLVEVSVEGGLHGDEGDHHDEHEGEHHEDEGDHHDEHEADHHHDGADPHTWMSPLNVMDWADRVAHALGEEDPANASYYEQRADEYKKELEVLDRKIRDSLAVIPEEKRVIVTGHNAFGYFARDYGVTVVGTIIPGFSTNSEPSARDMAELLNQLRESGVRALFVGDSSGEAILKLARSLERESGGDAKVVEFLTGSLRKKGEEGDSYISFMEYNLKQILYGLQL